MGAAGEGDRKDFAAGGGWWQGMRWWRRPEDTNEDIEFFLAEETAENVARGMTPEEARAAAQRKFGNSLRVSEDVRWVWLPRWMDEFGQDMRYAGRTYRRAKVFTVTLLLMIALGIGVNATVFSLVNALLLRPLPYPEAERLVAYNDRAKASRFKPGIQTAEFGAWRKDARSFELLGGYQYQDSVLSSGDEAVTVKTVTAAGDLWQIFGVRPLWGHRFVESEPAGSVVLSHKIFSQFFAGDRTVIGKQVVLAGSQVTIVGVLPPAFRFLLPQEQAGLELREPDLFVPSGSLGKTRLSVVGRLRPGVTPQEGLAEIRTLQAALLQASPDRWFGGIEIMQLQPLRERLAGRIEGALTVLQIAGLLVLLIACANVAGLLLARGLARQREVSIRIAIGAGRGRLLRQYFCEGLLLAVLGGAGGVLLAKALLWGIHQWGAQVLPRLGEAEMDGRVLLFVTLLSLVSAMLFAFWPAVFSQGADLSGSLRTRGGGEGSGSRRVRMALAGVELAIAVVLAIGAGLMIRSFGVMYAAVSGLEPERVLMMRLSLAGPEYREKARVEAAIGEVEAALRALPGAAKAGLAARESYLLQRANNAVPHVVSRFDESLVTPEYFASIGMRLVRGRWLEEGDAADAAVINETMARRVFGNEDPIGRTIDLLGRPVRVVGVAGDLKYSRMDEDVAPELFRGYARNIGQRPSLFLAIRCTGDAAAMAAAARTRLAAIVPGQAIYGVQTLDAHLAESIAPRRLNFALLLSFAGIALVMSVVGIYGVVAYSVTQRTHEIGIRRALGASAWDVAASVLRYGMFPALLGTVTGLLVSIAFARWMANLVYGVQPLDGVTFAVVPVLLVLAVTAACLIPALRAVRIDPQSTLRME